MKTDVKNFHKDNSWTKIRPEIAATHPPKNSEIEYIFTAIDGGHNIFTGEFDSWTFRCSIGGFCDWHDATYWRKPSKSFVADCPSCDNWKLIIENKISQDTHYFGLEECSDTNNLGIHVFEFDQYYSVLIDDEITESLSVSCPNCLIWYKASLLAADCVGYLVHSGENVEFYLNMNDVFYPAADGELVNFHDIIKVFGIYKRFETDGLIAWVQEKRKNFNLFNYPSKEKRKIKGIHKRLKERNML